MIMTPLTLQEAWEERKRLRAESLSHHQEAFTLEEDAFRIWEAALRNAGVKVKKIKYIKSKKGYRYIMENGEVFEP